GMDYELEKIDGIAEGGKLVVKGKNVMKGYLFYDRPGQLVPSEYNGEKGWYDTGDVVTIDQDGYMAIKGRVKRFAKIAGEMVTLETTERLFKSVYAEDDHAAVVRKDPSKGEAIVLFTTQKDVVRADVSAMAKSLGMPELAVARDVRALVAIPLFGSGKVDYVTLTKMAQEV
ncbi:MAG: bifunctional 2-acylglycerophosphoethanolamine acyltransferase/acyl-ACP synthetase, partial [Wohlfahrtiimonas sp.]